MEDLVSRVILIENIIFYIICVWRTQDFQNPSSYSQKTFTIVQLYYKFIVFLIAFYNLQEATKK